MLSFNITLQLFNIDSLYLTIGVFVCRWVICIFFFRCSCTNIHTFALHILVYPYKCQKRYTCTHFEYDSSERNVDLSRIHYLGTVRQLLNNERDHISITRRVCLCQNLHSIDQHTFICQSYDVLR